jgi:hypothetical protein
MMVYEYLTLVEITVITYIFADAFEYMLIVDLQPSTDKCYYIKLYRKEPHHG